MEQDFRTVGHVYMKAGRGSKARKFFLKANKNTPGNIAALVALCQVDGVKTKHAPCLHQRLNQQVQSSWKTERTIFALNMRLEVKSIRFWLSLKPVNAKIRLAKNRPTESERNAMKSPTVYNLRICCLQTAMDSLQPKHDYYQYS